MRWWPWSRPDRSTELRAELSRVRLDLAEREEELRRARDDLARERGQGRWREQESADTEVAGLVAAIATPLAQLVTLAHLREQGAVEPRVADVLAVAGRLVRALEDRDVRAVGVVGEQEGHDPDRHEPVGADPLEPDTPVVVRFVGFTHGTRVVRKAGVEPAAAPTA